MIVPIRNTKNKSSASNSSNSNMAPVINDIDMVDNCVANNIIFNSSDRNDEVKGRTFVPSAISSRSVLSSFSNKSEELYSVWMQRESNNMVQDKPTATFNSIQLKYVSQSVQNPNVSKTTNISLNMRIECGHNVVPTHVNTTTDSNSDIFNIQLNYNVN